MTSLSTIDDCHQFVGSEAIQRTRDKATRLRDMTAAHVILPIIVAALPSSFHRLRCS